MDVENAWTIATVADAQAWISLPGKVTQRELSALTAIANGVTGAIESFLRRNVVRREIVTRIDGSGTSNLVLPMTPVLSDGIGSVVLLDVNGDAAETVPSDEYFVDVSVGMLAFYRRAIPRARANVELTYSPGWTRATVPSEIILAARLWVLEHWKQWNGGTGRDDVTSSSVSGVTTTYANDPIPRRVERLLKPYRRTAGSG